jgi:hypothetical protein
MSDFEQKGKRCTFRKTELKTTTLNNILEETSNNKVIHFLKIDVEHYEKKVLEGIDLMKHRPWIIVVEATWPAADIPCFNEWEPILLDNKYVFSTQNDINRYYLAMEKHDELLNNFMARPYIPAIRRLDLEVLRNIKNGTPNIDLMESIGLRRAGHAG